MTGRAEGGTSRRGPYARTLQRREKIACEVLAQIDEGGHEGVTTGLIAKRTAIPEATVLYHFPTKEHLLVAALEQADEIEVALAGGDEPKTSVDLQALRRAAEEGLRNNERRVRLYLMLKGQSATPGHPAAEYFQRRNARSIRVFARLVANQQREGLAHPGLDPEEVARQILALWDGLTSMWINDRSFEVAPLLIDAFRRLTGENWMRARALINAPEAGL